MRFPIISAGGVAGFPRRRSGLLLLPCLLLPAALLAQDFAYTINNGEVTITGYGGFSNVVAIPDTIEGWPVTRIGNFAFYNLTNVTSVTIPNTVTGIGSRSFAFCTSLAGVALPDSLASIGDWAFASCASLSGVTIPLNVSSVGTHAFYDCTSLGGIEVAEQNTFYNSVDGVLFNESQTTLIQCPAAKTGGYIVPNTVTNIESGAFSYCADLAGISIPNSVSRIGDEAFDSCASLTNITLPAGLGLIDDWTFAKCGGLRRITLPDSLARIGRYAFYYCTGLTRVTIPNNVTNIGIGAFANCWELRSATFPASVSSIGDRAFYWCTNLTELLFLGNAPATGSDVFYNITNVTVYHLPGTTGWGETFAGLPTAVWNPPLQIAGDNIGVWTNGFGFTITGPHGLVVIVEACTNLSNPFWTPVGTNTLTGGGSDFRDLQWSNYPSRFYRVRPGSLAPAQAAIGNVGILANQFGFTITGTSDLVVAVEVCTNLASPVWAPLGTNTLTDGSSYFSDAEWTNHPNRFYRLRWQ